MNHYSLQGDHAHLIVEAHGKDALARGMKSIAARLARALNRVAGRSGPVLDSRYHHRSLRSPREVRRALAYVLLNARRHLAKRRARRAGCRGPARSCQLRALVRRLAAGGRGPPSGRRRGPRRRAPAHLAAPHRLAAAWPGRSGRVTGRGVIALGGAGAPRARRLPLPSLDSFLVQVLREGASGSTRRSTSSAARAGQHRRGENAHLRRGRERTLAEGEGGDEQRHREADAAEQAHTEQRAGADAVGQARQAEPRRREREERDAERLAEQAGRAPRRAPRGARRDRRA